MCFPFSGSLKDTKEKAADPFCRRHKGIDSVIKVTTAELQGSNTTTTTTTKRRKKKEKKKENLFFFIFF